MSPGDLGPLSDSAFELLNHYVDRFYAARKSNPDTPLNDFLPPPGGRLRREVVLVELIKTDMELRAQENLPIRLEDYIAAFPHDLSRARIDPTLLTEEYRLRRRGGENPPLEEYHRRFPERYDAMLARLGSDIAATRWAEDFDTVSNAGGRTTHEPSASGALAGLGYRLIRLIGRGTFGEVYEAEAPGPVRVAVKRISRSIDDPASKGEIEALEAIKSLSTHPFLVTTTAYWVFEDRLLIAMELADGNLDGRLRACQRAGLDGIPKEELVPVIEQAAAGLNFLHENGVTHRDVKPENILLQKGFAKVGDFGLARAQNHTQTIIQSPMGTLPFIAPEVFKNKMSPRSDQYSLAASYVLARLGRLLFPSVTAEALIVCHLTATPDLHELPPPEQKVLLRALAKSPEDRYPSCVAFAKALRAATLAPAKPPRPTSLWVTVAVAATVCALMIGGLDQLNKPRGGGDGGNGNAGGANGGGVQQPKLWVPDGWTAVGEARAKTSGQKEYYKKIKRKIGEQDVVALLVPQDRSDDPKPFYLTENKITNGAFKAEWNRTKGFRTFQQDDPNRGRYVPGEWLKGPKLLPDGRRVGIDGKDNMPVLCVTLPEAMLFAEGIDGRLPTLEQLQKAVGILDNKHPGPAGPAIEVPDHLKGVARIDFLRERLRESRRNLALGLKDGPRDVTLTTDDVSFCGIHQLLSNGLEWTGTRQGDHPSMRLKLSPLPAVSHDVMLFGQWWGSAEVLTLATINDHEPRVRPWTRWEEEAGFRIVIDDLP